MAYTVVYAYQKRRPWSTDHTSAVTVHHTRLFHVVEELLASSGTLFDPRLVLAPPKILRGLHDADGGIHEVGDSSSQKVEPRAEIGVEYDEGFP